MNIEKLDKSEVESLMEDCQQRLQKIKEQKLEQNRIKNKKNFKSKIGDLEISDPIFLIRQEPTRKGYKQIYKVLKCYVLNKFEEDDYMNLSIVHTTETVGSYGIHISKEDYDNSYFLDINSFYTLDIDNWKGDLRKSYISKFEKEKEELDKKLDRYMKLVDEFETDEDAISKKLIQELNK